MSLKRPNRHLHAMQGFLPRASLPSLLTRLLLMKCGISGVSREGGHAFDFRSTTHNLSVSWHEEEFERATPSGRARPRFHQRFLLRFRPRVRPILKRAHTRESSHKHRRDAAVVVFGREGSQAFDFWSTTLNLDVISHKGGSAQATSSGRSGVRARRKSRF